MPESRLFNSADYPYGCRCTCCNGLFEEGGEMYDRVVGPFLDGEATSPVCPECEASGAPLRPDHPLLQDEDVTLCADGLVR